MNLHTRPVLLLDSCNSPISIMHAQRALLMLTKGKVAVVLSTDIQAYPGIYIPSVVRLVEYKYIESRPQLPNKKNIYLRDNYTCQYCGRQLPTHHLTWDHVLPRSRGGKNTWTNLVTSCQPCNRRKDDLTPEEANMPLLRKILPSTVHTSKQLLRNVGLKVNEWAPYLFVDSAGDPKYSHKG
jgi:5-methylcytosine-specific restriction endonuclease McrA